MWRRKIETYLYYTGYNILATDMEQFGDIHLENISWRCGDNTIDSVLNWKKLDILQPAKYDVIEPREVVICSEVLEHLHDWRVALKNLIALAKTRVIITVPVEGSFNDPGHVNHWNDETIQEWKTITKPYATSIQRIRTKPKDVEMKQWAYLIIIDKRQKYE